MRLPVFPPFSLFLLTACFAIPKFESSAADPFVSNEDEPIEAPEGNGPAVFTILEWIEVDQQAFARWTLDHRLTVDATDLRREVQKWIESKEAELIDSVVIQSLSGSVASTEATDEKIYPTEYTYTEDFEEPAKRRGKEGDGLMTPQAFETRNMGLSLQIEATVDPADHSVRMEICPEVVTLKGFTAWPSDDVPENRQAFQPDFFTSKTQTDLRLKDGKFSLLGSAKAPAKEEGGENRFVLLFVRADVDKGDPKKPER